MASFTVKLPIGSQEMQATGWLKSQFVDWLANRVAGLLANMLTCLQA
jgi:hypothetical protein